MQIFTKIFDFFNNPKTASKGFYVYKFLKKNNESPYKDFLWEKGYRYIETFSFSTCMTYFDVERGLYSFKTIKDAKVYQKKNGYAVGDSVHKDRVKLVTMWIPRGAEYFIDEGTGEICSNKLTWH